MCLRTFSHLNMEDMCFNASPIRRLTLEKTSNSRADAFLAAVLRSTFRKRHYTAVFKQWFNWVSWKKDGASSCQHSDFTPFIVTQSEFRRSQVLKTIMAWSFILWSSYCSKQRKHKQLRAVIVQLSIIRRLHSAISKLNITGALMHAYNRMLSKFFSAHRRHFLTQSFRVLRTLWRASRLQRRHNFRLTFSKHNHWRKLCQAKRARWNCYFACALLLRYVRTWRTLIHVKQVLVALHSRVLAHSQAKCLCATFCAWRICHFKRRHAIRMHRARLLNLSLQHWLLESVFRKHRRLAEIKVQNVFKLKSIRAAICVIASWAQKSRRNQYLLITQLLFQKFKVLKSTLFQAWAVYAFQKRNVAYQKSIMTKLLFQKFKVLKSTLFRAWAFYAFQKRNVAYQNSIQKRIKMAVIKHVRIFFVCWWIQMKQVSRTRILQKSRSFNLVKIAARTWSIITRHMSLFRTNNATVLIRRRSRRVVCSVFAVWKVVSREEARKKKILQNFNVRLFHLSRVFLAFLSSCRHHRDQLRRFSQNSVAKLCLRAWSERSQQSSMLLCTLVLLTNMRNIRQAHMAVKHLLQMIRLNDFQLKSSRTFTKQPSENDSSGFPPAS